jgi:xanthine dehydrogenase YagS FAD-binding subunit
MQPFDFARTSDAAQAIKSNARFVAGGTNLIDLMKADVEHPAHLLDINGIAMNAIERTSDGIRLGALVRMSDAAENTIIREHFPVISQALLASASPQIRNAASLGGNLMQRTRCPYFRELLFAECNKRNPGSGCAAIDGENRGHAVLGGSPSCIATHPSDFAVAFAALDGVITLRGPNGERQVKATDFHLLPGNTPHVEHDLKPGELIASLFIPDAPHAQHSAYLKVRDRSSYEFAVASAAVGLELSGDTIRSARIALGGIGTKPWRSREAEAALTGKTATAANFRAAAEAAMKGAKDQGQNGFKIELAKRTLVRALSDLAGGAA